MEESFNAMESWRRNECGGARHLGKAVGCGAQEQQRPTGMRSDPTPNPNKSCRLQIPTTPLFWSPIEDSSRIATLRIQLGFSISESSLGYSSFSSSPPSARFPNQKNPHANSNDRRFSHDKQGQLNVAKKIAAKIEAAATNRGGRKAGLADCGGAKKGSHAKFECPYCKTTAPDIKSMQILLPINGFGFNSADRRGLFMRPSTLRTVYRDRGRVLRSIGAEDRKQANGSASQGRPLR
ncbi:hypothetical protein L484_022771 [Morus notabilis]|uniref:Uncharacterized protein n=1 Tax=Morus notabilis TaxID=981085 RepID=W9T0H9_9ROSA|nr:hypothetical protein L484_022771 [Morus notabilis]